MRILRGCVCASFFVCALLQVQVAQAQEAPAAMSDEGYSVRLREIQSQLDELKENVFRSKSRLYLLREQILEDSVGSAQARVRYANDLGANYEIVTLRYSLDGAPIFSSATASEDVNELEVYELYVGQVQPGVHTLAVQMTVQGRGRGPFTYTRGYEFDVLTSHVFTVEGGETVALDAVMYRSGDTSNPYEVRPDVRFDEDRLMLQGEVLVQADDEQGASEALDEVESVEESGSAE